MYPLTFGTRTDPFLDDSSVYPQEILPQEPHMPLQAGPPCEESSISWGYTREVGEGSNEMGTKSKWVPFGV